MIEADELLEHAKVYSDYKGIPKSQVREAFASGKDVIMRLDVQGAMTIRRICPDAILIFLTATLAAIGAPGIPEAGLVTMVVVFEAVGLDPIHIGALLSVDWFLDRCRTTINVWGDVVGTAVIQTLDRGSNGNHEIS